MSVLPLILAAAINASPGSVQGTDGVRLVRVNEVPLAVDGCSGIAYSGKGNLFYFLQDHGDDGRSRVYPMALDIDFSTGAVKSSPTPGASFVPGRCTDAEGIAYDVDYGRVWISDEKVPTVAEYGLDGAMTGRAVALPKIQLTKKRSNKSLESLTISPDGRTLWTANEQALFCDGDSSCGNATVKTVVRLMKYTRASATAGWTAAGQWAYACDVCEVAASAECGVSGLCALEDGSLLVLEREVSVSSFGRCRIYRLAPSVFSKATDVTAFAALKKSAYTAVAKGDPLVDFSSGRMEAMYVYEGITLGPRLRDGSRAVYLVSDGGETSTRTVLGVSMTARTASLVCALKLTGVGAASPAAKR